MATIFVSFWEPLIVHTHTLMHAPAWPSSIPAPQQSRPAAATGRTGEERTSCFESGSSQVYSVLCCVVLCCVSTHACPCIIIVSKEQDLSALKTPTGMYVRIYMPECTYMYKYTSPPFFFQFFAKKIFDYKDIYSYNSDSIL